jgi:type IV pilus assembly protein PilA
MKPGLDKAKYELRCNMLQKLSGNNERGFTLIELMIVIAIIGILAAIAIPNFITYRQRGFDATANSDVKNAYTAAQAYFTGYPNGGVSLGELTQYGFVQSGSVTVTVVSGSQSNLQITASHTNGVRTYTVNSSGSISF